MSAKIAVSQYQGSQECSYREFEVTAEGLRDAQAYLDTRLVNGFRRSLPEWQFEDGWTAVEDAEQLVRAGDVAGLLEFLRAQEVRV